MVDQLVILVNFKYKSVVDAERPKYIDVGSSPKDNPYQDEEKNERIFTCEKGKPSCWVVAVLIRREPEKYHDAQHHEHCSN